MKVQVVSSVYSDINPGDLGTVTGRKGEGYSVNITKPFNDARHMRSEGTRELWFKASEIKLANKADN